MKKLIALVILSALLFTACGSWSPSEFENQNLGWFLYRAPKGGEISDEVENDTDGYRFIYYGDENAYISVSYMHYVLFIAETERLATIRDINQESASEWISDETCFIDGCQARRMEYVTDDVDSEPQHHICYAIASDYYTYQLELVVDDPPGDLSWFDDETEHIHIQK